MLHSLLFHLIRVLQHMININSAIISDHAFKTPTKMVFNFNRLLRHICGSTVKYNKLMEIQYEL